MVRGAGKFKTKRGGGRSFSRHLALDENGIAVSSDRRNYRRSKDQEEEDDDEDEDDDEEESSEEEEDSEEDEDEAELSRTERRELKKKAKSKGGQPSKTPKKEGEEGDDDEEEEDGDKDKGADILVNPNHVKKKLNIADLDAPRELSRREREAIEKKEAQERYWKLHQQGKTDQAKADLARLAKIRKEREEALAKRKAEAEAKAKEIEVKKAAQKSGKRV
ncbi:hypothetical protein ACEPAI_2089 [Sanghuangporus weigelae]